MKKYAVIDNAAKQVDVFRYRSPAERLGNLKIVFVYSVCVCMALEDNITKIFSSGSG